MRKLRSHFGSVAVYEHMRRDQLGEWQVEQGRGMMSILQCGCLFIVLISSTAKSADIFELQGSYTKAHGGAGVIMSGSGTATLHNPANLWANSDSDYYVDFSPSKLDYQFTPPDPELPQGQISVPVAPFLSFGGSFKASNSPLAIGYYLAPTGIGTTTKVDDFPASVNGQFQVASIESSAGGFKTGIGLAYKVMPSLCLGLSVLYDYSDNSTKIFLRDAEFLNLVTRGRSIRTGLGARYEWSGFGSFALSFQPEKQLHYSLKAKVAGATPVQVFQKDFRPRSLGLGFRSEPIGRFEPYGQYTNERWVSATFIARSPTQAINGEIPVEYLNTHNFVVGSRFRMMPRRNLVASYSSFQKNKGNGLFAADGSTVLMQGRGAQDFEALDRFHVTVGYESLGRSSDWLYYGAYIRGTATAEPDTPAAGFYELTILMLGFGYVGKLSI
ncbi:MAG: hypothetical protein ACOH5I_13940 [Oligoflexus sp.]